MTRRPWHEPQTVGTEGLPMFAPTPTQVGIAKRDATASRCARDIERLIPLALELAAKAGEHGVTVSDLRLYAVKRGILTGAEEGRKLSYLGKVMEAAGLRNTKTFRRSVTARSNGNLHAVWCLTSRDNVPDSAA